MIDGLKPYPEYKEADLLWLDKVPAHWEVRRQRNVANMLVSNVDKHTIEGEIPVRLCNYVDVYKHDVITDRIPFMRATASQAEINRFRLQIDDVVITKDSETWDDIGVPALVAYEAPDLVCGYHLAILRSRKDVMCGAFLLRALQSQGVAAQYYVSANGVTRFGLSHDAIKSVSIPVPPLPEQQAIARFLDHHDRFTRRYIRAQRRLIELLTEQKQALIQRAVTRGLDPDVPLKDSSIEWLGEIPAHWDVIRVRSLVESIDQGISPQAEVFLADDNSWGVLKSGCVNGGFFRETEHKRLPNGFEIDPEIVVKVGDVLVSRACGSHRFVGSVGRIRSLNYKLILSDKTFRLNFTDHRLVDFLVFAMNSRYFRIQVEQGISGAEGLANNLPLSELKDFRILVPPPAEAETLAKVLRSKTEQINIAVDRTQHQIDLVREYRTRLITDVVTGKLDVRGVSLSDLDEDAFDTVEEITDLDDLDEQEMNDAES